MSDKYPYIYINFDKQNVIRDQSGNISIRIGDGELIYGVKEKTYRYYVHGYNDTEGKPDFLCKWDTELELAQDIVAYTEMLKQRGFTVEQALKNEAPVLARNAEV